MKSLPKNFKTISDDMVAEGIEKEIIDRVLKKECVLLQDFAIKKETGSFFRCHDRPVLLIPKETAVSEPEIDELNDKGRQNTFKVKVSFMLSKGSYATVVTKRIFNQ